MRAWMLALAVALAGCAGTQGTDDCPECDEPDAVADTGITGVVVDQAVVPVPDASVTLVPGNITTTTDGDGAFSFLDLSPGSYFVQVSKELFDPVQSQATVAAGDVAKLRIQLPRAVFAEPYTTQMQLAGYLFCSSNTGGLIAEECGEGVGVPCGVPVLGCERIGGSPENIPEVRFFTDGGLIRTIQAEVVWDPTLTVGNGIQEGGFTTILATHFVCDPVCRYEDSLDDKVGHSPIIMRTDDGDQGGKYFTAPDVALADANITDETPVSVFVWTSDEDLAAVTFDQTFEVLVTLSYVLPLPEGFAVVDGDVPPF